MDGQISIPLSFRRWVIGLSGLVFLVFGGFYFFSVSAQTDAVSKEADQSMVNGKLTYSLGIYGIGVPGRSISTANADGTGDTTLPVTIILDPNELAWSPDATKLAFALNESPGAFDIYVMNADGPDRLI